MNKQVAEQLSLFGLKPTAMMRKDRSNKIAIEIAEITDPPKEMIRYDKSR